MSEQHSGSTKAEVQAASPYGYPYWDWVTRQDPEYVKTRGPLSELSVGEGRELSVKYREMVIKRRGFQKRLTPCPWLPVVSDE